MLQIKNLTKIYDGGVKALDNVSFDVPDGQFLAVIGLSGSGKSTLLRCINRLIEPTSGQILWDGEDITAASQEEMRRIRRKIGMVFQHFNLVHRSKVPVYAAGLGNPGPWMERLRENGTKIMAVIGSVKHALQVAASGIDVVVAQGHDGGGHNSPIGTMALIPQVVDAMAGRMPVLGATQGATSPASATASVARFAPLSSSDGAVSAGLARRSPASRSACANAGAFAPHSPGASGALALAAVGADVGGARGRAVIMAIGFSAAISRHRRHGE